jgi:hypothetical protein
MLHPTELAAPYWAMVHPTELRGTPYGLAQLGYAAPYWATLEITEAKQLKDPNKKK